MAEATETGSADLVLQLRLDALHKNLDQISEMRGDIQKRREEVDRLHCVAKDTEVGIEWRLKSLLNAIRNSADEVKALRNALGAPARFESLSESLDNAARRAGEIE